MQKLGTTIKVKDNLGDFINQFLERKAGFGVMYNLGIEAIVMHPKFVHKLEEYYFSHPVTPHLIHNMDKPGCIFFGFPVLQCMDIAEDEVKLIIE